jgi:DNA-binding XRE family transcriptional regulator
VTKTNATWAQRFGAKRQAIDRAILAELEQTIAPTRTVAAGRFVPYIRAMTGVMIPEELRAARKALGLTQAEFANVFDVDIRTVKAWEAGHRDGRPSPVPRPIAVLVRLAQEQASVRLALGIPSEGKTAKTKPHRVVSGPHSGPHSG